MKRVLIVDDAATVRMFHRRILEAEGLQVEEAINGIEALEKALAGSFDLYVVDINMPKMDGYVFVRQLRGNDEIRPAPVLMVSTESENRDANQAYQVGANFYMVKPVKPGRLAGCARIMIGEVKP